MCVARFAYALSYFGLFRMENGRIYTYVHEKRANAREREKWYLIALFSDCRVQSHLIFSLLTTCIQHNYHSNKNCANLIKKADSVNFTHPNSILAYFMSTLIE